MLALDLPPFLLASFLIELTPGPNMAYLALISATLGRRYGFATTAGVALGLLTIGLLAAIGVAQIVTRSPTLFQLLRWAGVIYLLYLAWTGWRVNGETSPSRQRDDETLPRYFRHGLVINLLNPKAGLFFIAILPTFLPESPATLDAPILTAIYVFVATAVHLFLVVFCAQLNPFLADPARSQIFRRALSIGLVLVAGWMAWATRGGL
jgi:threonine/homoserine/homoserine lactone efflux protein